MSVANISVKFTRRFLTFVNIKLQSHALPSIIYIWIFTMYIVDPPFSLPPFPHKKKNPRRSFLNWEVQGKIPEVIMKQVIWRQHKLANKLLPVIMRHLSTKSEVELFNQRYLKLFWDSYWWYFWKPFLFEIHTCQNLQDFLFLKYSESLLSKIFHFKLSSDVFQTKRFCFQSFEESLIVTTLNAGEWVQCQNPPYNF